MVRYGIRSIFVPIEGDGESKYAYFDTLHYLSIDSALLDVNGAYGELLASFSIIDSETDEELNGYMYDDLEPYEIGTEPYNV